MKYDGIVSEMTRDEYESVDALNQSTVKIAYDRSLLHARWELLHPSASSDAEVEGQALHTLILEPELFEKRFAPMPVNENGDRMNRRHKVGEVAWAEYDREHGTKHPIKPARIAEMRAIREAVMAHPLARKLIEGSVFKEVCAFWEHPDYGFRCKGQIDLISDLDGWTVVCDLKSALDASPNGFRRAVANYGYMVQAHWYLEGLKTIADADRRFLFVAFEKDPPFAVCVHELAADLMLEAKFRCDTIAQRWARALETGKFPGYGAGIQIVDAPKWALTHERLFDESPAE